MRIKKTPFSKINEIVDYKSYIKTKYYHTIVDLINNTIDLWCEIVDTHTVSPSLQHKYINTINLYGCDLEFNNIGLDLKNEMKNENIYWKEWEKYDCCEDINTNPNPNNNNFKNQYLRHPIIYNLWWLIIDVISLKLNENNFESIQILEKKKGGGGGGGGGGGCGVYHQKYVKEPTEWFVKNINNFIFNYVTPSFPRSILTCSFKDIYHINLTGFETLLLDFDHSCLLKRFLYAHRNLIIEILNYHQCSTHIKCIQNLYFIDRFNEEMFSHSNLVLIASILNLSSTTTDSSTTSLLDRVTSLFKNITRAIFKFKNISFERFLSPIETSLLEIFESDDSSNNNNSSSISFKSGTKRNFIEHTETNPTETNPINFMEDDAAAVGKPRKRIKLKSTPNTLLKHWANLKCNCSLDTGGICVGGCFNSLIHYYYNINNDIKSESELVNLFNHTILYNNRRDCFYQGYNIGAWFYQSLIDCKGKLSKKLQEIRNTNTTTSNGFEMLLSFVVEFSSYRWKMLSFTRIITNEEEDQIYLSLLVEYVNQYKRVPSCDFFGYLELFKHKYFSTFSFLNEKNIKSVIQRYFQKLIHENISLDVYFMSKQKRYFKDQLVKVLNTQPHDLTLIHQLVDGILLYYSKDYMETDIKYFYRLYKQKLFFLSYIEHQTEMYLNLTTFIEKNKNEVMSVLIPVDSKIIESNPKFKPETNSESSNPKSKPETKLESKSESNLHLVSEIKTEFMIHQNNQNLNKHPTKNALFMLIHSENNCNMYSFKDDHINFKKYSDMRCYWESRVDATFIENEKKKYTCDYIKSQIEYWQEKQNELLLSSQQLAANEAGDWVEYWEKLL
jgi:hypothetical protein